MNPAKTEFIDIKLLRENKGQIVEVPQNPRLIRGWRFDKLKKSITDNPEMLQLRELIVYPFSDKYIVIAGNMRLAACKELGYTEVPCKVLDKTTTPKQLRAIAIKDNVAFGEEDWDMLANEWDEAELLAFGMEIPEVEDMMNLDELEEAGEDSLDDFKDVSELTFELGSEDYDFVVKTLESINANKNIALIQLCEEHEKK